MIESCSIECFQIRDGKRDGLGLSEAKRLELNSLKKELDLVCSEFSVSPVILQHRISLTP